MFSLLSMLLRTYDPPEPNGQQGGKSTRGGRGSPPGRTGNPGHPPAQPSNGEPQLQDDSPLEAANSTPIANGSPSRPLQRTEPQPVIPKGTPHSETRRNHNEIANAITGGPGHQAVPPSRTVNANPRTPWAPPSRAPRLPPSAKASASRPIPRTQPMPTTPKAAPRSNTQQNVRGATNPLSHPRKEARAMEAGTNSTATYKSGSEFLCNSKNFSVGQMDVTTVSYGFSAEQVERIKEEMRAEFQRNLPPGVRLSDANSWIITNALGETITLHLSFVQTYDDLDRFLAFQFKGKIGEDRVKNKRYRIADATNGSMVKAEDWGKISEERRPLVMSMLIEQVYLPELEGTCPKCEETELGTYIDQGWIVCRKCNTRCLREGEVRTTTDRKEIRNMKPDADGAHFRHVVKTRIRWEIINPNRIPNRIPNGGPIILLLPPISRTRTRFENELRQARKERRMNEEKSRFQELND